MSLAAESTAATPGVKPEDRDEHAVKSDEMDHPALNDYTNPDGIISAICRGEYDCSLKSSLRPAKCAEHQNKIHSISNVADHNSPNVEVPDDQWLETGQHGMWVRLHSLQRRTMETPAKLPQGPPSLEHLSSLRYTVGCFKNGQPFTNTDSWRNQEVAHRELKHPWTGITCYFTRDCDSDTQIDRLCSLTSSITDLSMEKAVRFSPNEAETILTPAYCQEYGRHPHHMLATASGWKRAPARADPYTGKSATAMTARREA